MEITKHQVGITESVPSSELFMSFEIKEQSQIECGLKILQKFVDGKSIVAGFGNNLLAMFDIPEGEIYQRTKFSSERMSDTDGYDLVLWLRGEDKGEIFHQAINIKKALKDFFEFKKCVTSFTYRKKYDLAGFEYGIENPKDKAVMPAAIVVGGAVEGSSFWVLQQWQHNFEWLNSVSQVEKEECIGRSMDDSHQFENLKDFAHVKRSAKENFSPEAEILRKSMPWADDNLNGGFMFSGFATSFRSFNLQMGNMLGGNDGMVDGVFKFSKVLETSYLWCPPFKTGKLDLFLIKK